MLPLPDCRRQFPRQMLWTGFLCLVLAILLDEDALDLLALHSPALLWQLLTYQVVHLGWPHLISNLVMLATFGAYLEVREPRWAMPILLGGGVVAGLTHSLLLDIPVAGLSGGLAAVAGACLTLYGRETVRVVYMFILVAGVGECRMAWAVAVLAGSGLLMAALVPGYHVAHYAHLGGLLFGIAAGWAVKNQQETKRWN